MFSDSYRASINGTSTDLQTVELSGGARIFRIFRDSFFRTLEAHNPVEGLEAEHILTAIRNASGTRPALFIPEISFEFLAKKQIARLNEPALQCVEMVFEEMERLISLCCFPELSRFRLLRDRIVQCTMDLLRSRLEPTNRFVEDLIAIEVAYINTMHPDFEGTALLSQNVDPVKASVVDGPAIDAAPLPAAPAPKAASAAATAPIAQETEGRFNLSLFGLGRSKQDPLPQAVSIIGASDVLESLPAARPRPQASAVPLPSSAPATRTPKQMREVEMMRSLIVSYFSIVRKRVQDTVPKAIMHFMVNFVNEQLQNELVRSLYKPDSLAELLEEDPSLAAQRKSTAEMLAALQRASVIVTEVSDADLAV